MQHLSRPADYRDAQMQYNNAPTMFPFSTTTIEASEVTCMLSILDLVLVSIYVGQGLGGGECSSDHCF